MGRPVSRLAGVAVRHGYPNRILSLSAVVLRVSISLDLEAVLQESVDSARALSGDRYG